MFITAASWVLTAALAHAAQPAPPPAACTDPVPESVVEPVVSPFVYSGGTVVARVLVAPNGRVKSVRVTRPVPALVEPVVAALQQWTFEPSTCDGDGYGRVRVEAWTTVAVHVTLVRNVSGRPDAGPR